MKGMYIEVLNPLLKYFRDFKPKQERFMMNVAYQMCPFCGFKGVTSYIERCRHCKAPLIFCPKCGVIECALNSRKIFEWRKTRRKNAKTYDTEFFVWRK